MPARVFVLPLAASLLALASCAPVAMYRGPVPAPGTISLGTGGAAPAADAARLAFEGADPGHHYLGRVALPAGADSLVVLLYGDNRPGYRMETRSTEWAAVRRLSWRPSTWPRGLLYLPVFLVESIVPALDGPRDVITSQTRNFSGGGEEEVLRALEREPAHLILNLGDLVQDGRRGRQWEDFVERHANIRSRTPYLAAVGNHERTATPEGLANWDAAMGAPAAPGRYWYAFDVPAVGTRFVVLDSNVFTDVKDRMADDLEQTLAEAQLAWADSVLDTPLPRRILAFHHPLVSAGHHYADWSRPVPAQRRERLFEIARRRRVTAVFTGHEHLYQRTFLAGPDSSAFWHIVSGGGGSPLYSVPREEHEDALARPLPAGFTLAPGSARLESRYHYCRLAIPRADGPTATLPVEVRRVSGDRVTRIDRLDLARAPIVR